MWHQHVPVGWSLFREMSVNSCEWHHALWRDLVFFPPVVCLTSVLPQEDIDPTSCTASLLYQESSLINSAFSSFLFSVAGNTGGTFKLVLPSAVAPGVAVWWRLVIRKMCSAWYVCTIPIWWLLQHTILYPLEHNGYYMCHHVSRPRALHSSHTVHLRVSCDFRNTVRFFPCTVLTVGICEGYAVCLLRCTTLLLVNNSG